MSEPVEPDGEVLVGEGTSLVCAPDDGFTLGPPLVGAVEPGVLDSGDVFGSGFAGKPGSIGEVTVGVGDGLESVSLAGSLGERSEEQPADRTRLSQLE